MPVHLRDMNLRGGPLAKLMFVLAALTASVSAEAQAQGTQSLRVAVIHSPDSAGPKESLKAVQIAVAQALSEAGVETVPAGRLPKETASCAGAECTRALDAKTNATHALLVRAVYAKEAFNMVIDVWSVRTHTLVASEARDCAICDLRDFEGAAQALTAALIPRIPRDDVQAPPMPPPSLTMGTSPAESAPPSAVTIGRWAGLGTGVALLGVGIYYLLKDGDNACRAGEMPPCDRLHDTKAGGLALMASGVVVGAAAIVVPMLITSQDGTKMAGVFGVGKF